MFLAVQALVLGVVLLIRQIGRSETSTLETAWSTIAAFASLGWAGEALPGHTAGSPATPQWLLAWLGALGWPVWLLTVPRLSRRYAQARGALAMLAAYAAILLLAALLIAALESPRGRQPYADRSGATEQRAGQRSMLPPAPGKTPETLSAQPLAARYAHSLVQVAAASGAGIPTVQSEASRYPLAELSAGTKVTLSALLLIGGLGGSATGGVQFPLLLWTLAGGAAALSTRLKATLGASAARWMHAGLACTFLLTLLACVVALGMLMIENWTASRFEPPPAFADALLDACSVVGGGNLSAGLTETVTARNLVGGIGQPASLYQYGMTWLMLAMLAGRLLPLVVLSQMSSRAATRADSV